ncbi:MAG: hypothetical protein CUN55_11435 [Phototrophicales bacterium]|nr:MAG: hypothetical protein CUN55_11435 [Phototrophicales bacterium]
MIEQRFQHVQSIPFSPLHGLLGRDDVLQTLTSRLAEAKRLWVSGGLGVGKRALAAEFAKQYVNINQPVVWLTLHHDSFDTLCERLCRLYHCVTQKPDAETYQTLKQRLSDDAPLLIVNGIHTNRDVLVVKMLLDVVVPEIPVLLLSHVEVNDEFSLALAALDDVSAEALYRTIGQIAPSRRTALLAPLLRYIDGWPFGIVLAAYQSAALGITSTHFASLLPQTPPSPQSRCLGIIDAAFRQLDSTEQGLLLLLGVLFADYARLDFIQTISGIHSDTLQTLIHTLQSRGFIHRVQNEGAKSVFYLHDLVRLYARRRLQSVDQLYKTRTKITQGILRYVLKHTQHATEEDFEALAYAADQIYEAMRFAEQLHDTQYTQTIVKLLARYQGENFVSSLGYYAWYQRLQQMAGEFVEVANVEQQFRLRTAVMSVSEVVTEQGESLDNLLRAFADAHSVQDTYKMAHLALTIGDWYTNREQLKEAARFYDISIQNAHPQRDYDVYVRAVLGAAQTHVELEQPFEALSYLEKGLQYVGMHSADRGRMLLIAADARMILSDVDRALSDYQQAALLLENHHALIAAGVAMGKAAAILIDQGDYQEASVLLAQAAEVFERGGRKDLQGQALGNLGTALGYMGRWREAGKRHMLALQIAQELGDLDEVRYQLGNLAFVSETEGYLDWAVHYGRQALDLSLQLNDRQSAARHATDLGRLLMMNPLMTHQAVVLLEAALGLNSQPHIDALLMQARQLLHQAQEAGYAVYPPLDIEDFARADNSP